MRRMGLGAILMAAAVLSPPAAGTVDAASSPILLGYVVRGSTVTLFEGAEPGSETCTLATGSRATLGKMRRKHDIAGWPNGGRARFWLQKVTETVPPPLEPEEFVQFDREVKVRGMLVWALCGNSTIYWIKKIQF